MLTGRPVKDRTVDGHAVEGHGWTINNDEQPENLHANHHAYVASTFDVIHDHGLRTGLFATKTKFKIYENSYGGPNGEPDKVGPDNGRDKIDVYVIAEGVSPTMLAALSATMKTEPLSYAFVHFHDPDAAGHASLGKPRVQRGGQEGRRLSANAVGADHDRSAAERPHGGDSVGRSWRF